MTDQTEPDLLAKIPRNVAIGFIVMFVVTVLMALPSGMGVGAAAVTALLPAVFAGPFVGGLMTVVAYQRLEAHDQGS